MSGAAPEPHGPMLAAGDEPPGRVIDGQWQGALDWCTQHGPAIVQWSLGVPMYVWNAHGADGARVNVEGRSPASDLFRLDQGSSLVLGNLEINSDDVVFGAVQHIPDYDVDEALRRLFDLLRADEPFMQDLAPPAAAGALYAMLENKAFVTGDGTLFEFGQRSAAHFVAALRACGEDYLDFAWGRGPSFAEADAERVRAHLSRLGVTAKDLDT